MRYDDLTSRVFAALIPTYTQWYCEHSQKTSVSMTDLRGQNFDQESPEYKLEIKKKKNQFRLLKKNLTDS